MNTRDAVVAEVKRLLVLIKRRARRELPKECYEKLLEMINELEAKLEEYEYEEALKIWG